MSAVAPSSTPSGAVRPSINTGVVGDDVPDSAIVPTPLIFPTLNTQMSTQLPAPAVAITPLNATTLSTSASYTSVVSASASSSSSSSSAPASSPVPAPAATSSKTVPDSYAALDLALLSTPIKPSATQVSSPPVVNGVPSADAAFPLPLDAQAWAERQGFLIMQLSSGPAAAAFQKMLPSTAFTGNGNGSGSGGGSGNTLGALGGSPSASSLLSRGPPEADASFEELEMYAIQTALSSFDLDLLHSTTYADPASAGAGAAASGSASAAAATAAAASAARGPPNPAGVSVAVAPEDVPDPEAGPDIKDVMIKNMAAIWLENERRRLKAQATVKRTKTGSKAVLAIMSPFSPRGSSAQPLLHPHPQSYVPGAMSAAAAAAAGSAGGVGPIAMQGPGSGLASPAAQGSPRTSFCNGNGSDAGFGAGAAGAAGASAGAGSSNAASAKSFPPAAKSTT